MIKEIVTHYGTQKKARGPYDTRTETTVALSKAWQCTDCGEIFLENSGITPHECKEPVNTINMHIKTPDFKESYNEEDFTRIYVNGFIAGKR
jgi:hypothetical protein